MWVRAGVVDLQILGTAVHASSVGQRFGGDGAGLLGVEPKGAQDQGCRIGAGLAPCLMPFEHHPDRAHGRAHDHRGDAEVGLVESRVPSGRDPRIHVGHGRAGDHAAQRLVGQCEAREELTERGVRVGSTHEHANACREAARAIDPVQFVRERLGHDLDVDVRAANAWTPRLVVADSFGRGRVWLAGDAVHQVTPTGGYGMNTGVGDAAGLAWILAANLQGWGGPRLLEAYEVERRAVALRNREAAARHALVRAAIMTTDWRDMHSEGWSGDRTRRRLGREIVDLGNLENEALGIELGYRYDDLPVIAAEPGPRPKQQSYAYLPSTVPGVRPPSVWLADGQAIFDRLGTGFTLLRFTEHDTTALEHAAAIAGVPLDIVDVRDDHARALYERDLVLIRPDQHVAWRGNGPPSDPIAVIDLVRGANS